MEFSECKDAQLGRIIRNDGNSPLVFLNEHTNETCEIIIVDPGRGNHAKFSKMMVSLGYVHTQSEPLDTQDYLDEPFCGQIIKYSKNSSFIKSLCWRFKYQF